MTITHSSGELGISGRNPAFAKLTNTGVFFGKMIPPTRGHLNAIINASTLCEKLYVIVSDNIERTKGICKKSGIKHISLALRVQWLSQELQDIKHIKVLGLDESFIPVYPDGWQEWTDAVRELVPEEINTFYCGEHEYAEQLPKYFPNASTVVFDPERTTYNISATTVRENPMKHWDHILGPARPFFAKKILIVGTESCVDCDTEFFDGISWKRIADYKNGDNVLQFNSDYSASLVKPERYIKAEATSLYKLQNSYGNWSQVYSEDHDIVYVTSKGNIAKKPFSEVMDKHFNNEYGFQGKILNWFNYSGEESIEEFKLRLLIAISADGTKSKRKWRIRLKKERKIERLRYLIEQSGLELDERIYEDGYHNFFVPESYGTKLFDKKLMHLNKECKDIFIDEIFKWDGVESTSDYYTTLEHNKDIVQFILSSVGKKVQVYKDIREDKTTCYKVSMSSVKYTTMDINKITEKHRDTMITEYPTTDGYKYCFTVNSGMLVLRRDGQIFITGNCGKTTLVKMLAKLYHTSWSEEVGRDYAMKFLGGNELYFTDEDFSRIAHQQVEQDYHALRSANKICLFDTDATITQYYSNLYMGHSNPLVEAYIDHTKYDLVIMLKPDVTWVSDGQRLNGDQQKREHLHGFLLSMYQNRGFKNIIEVGGNYQERLQTAIKLINELIY